MNRAALFATLLVIVFSTEGLAGSGVMTYQGRVQSGGTDFTGTGQFKFALVTGSNMSFTTHWSSDGSIPAGGEPADAVSVSVSNGLFTVGLGDTGLVNMAGLDVAVFDQPDLELRIWFNDGVNGFAELDPPQPLTAAPYAFKAANADAAIAANTADLAHSVAAGAVGPDQLAAGAAAANLAADGQAGVASGGIVLSLTEENADLVNAGYVKIGSTALNGHWRRRSDSSPHQGWPEHTAVWTGSEVIYWGGFDSSNIKYVNDGGRYDPVGNSWRQVSTSGAPAGRSRHTAVWTGTEMIVWGGEIGGAVRVSDGGRYSPEIDSWSGLNTTLTPSPRSSHTAIWMSSEMLIWGGSDGQLEFRDTWSYTPGKLVYLYQKL